MSQSGLNNEVSQKNILQLNVDCFEELFECLTLSDLKALRQTCTRLRTIVDHHIKSTYPNGFGTLKVFEHMQPKDLRTFNASFRHLYKRVELGYYSISAELIDKIKPILSSVEKLIIFSAKMEIDYYKDLLQLCTNLKYLRMCFYNEFLDNDWWMHQLPSLEHFSLDVVTYSFPEEELQTFFDMNPNIRRLTIDGRFAIENGAWMKKSNIHLDELNIRFVDLDDESVICRLMNILFEKGFYKRLNFFFYFEYVLSIDFNTIEHVNGLNKLYLEDDYLEKSDRSSLPKWKEFSMFELPENDYVLNDLAENFMSIERIHFRNASFESILPFIRCSVRLNKVLIQIPESDGIYCDEGVIDLPALNKERQKCARATKVTIYVGEEFYLKTKKAFRRMNFSLVELKRAESIVWDLGINI